MEYGVELKERNCTVETAYVVVADGVEEVAIDTFEGAVGATSSSVLT